MYHFWNSFIFTWYEKNGLAYKIRGCDTKKDATKDGAMKMLDTRFANGEITKEQYNEMKKEIKK